MKKEQSTKFLKLCLADSLIKMMETQDYDSININAVCEVAGVGRTTYYRYFDKKSSKENLLVFKIFYEWDIYMEKHKDEVKKDKGAVLLNFIYENKLLFKLLYDNNLIVALMRIFEEIDASDWPTDKESSYLRAFLIYGYFGTIYQWIKYDFDETPEQVQQHILETIFRAQKTS